MNESIVTLLRGLRTAYDMTSVTRIPSWDTVKSAIEKMPYSDTDREAALSLRIEEIETVEFQVLMNDMVVEIERLVGSGVQKSQESFNTAWNKITGRMDIIIQKVREVREKTGRVVTVEEVIETDFPKIIESTDEGYLPILVSLIEARLTSDEIIGGGRK